MANIFGYDQNIGFGFDFSPGLGSVANQSGAQQATYQMAATLAKLSAQLRKAGLTNQANQVVQVEQNFYKTSQQTSHGQPQPAPMVLKPEKPAPVPQKIATYHQLTSNPTVQEQVTRSFNPAFIAGLVVLALVLFR